MSLLPIINSLKEKFPQYLYGWDSDKYAGLMVDIAVLERRGNIIRTAKETLEADLSLQEYANHFVTLIKQLKTT